MMSILRWWWLKTFRRATLNDYCITCGVHIGHQTEPCWCEKCGAE